MAVPFISLVARCLMAFIFLASGVMKLRNPKNVMADMAHHGIPLTGFFLAGAIAIELAGGLSVLTGFYANWGALLLFLYLIPTTWFFHRNIADKGQQQHLAKNLAIMGGLLLLFYYGSGPYSLH